MPFKASFIFVCNDTEPNRDKAVITNDAIELHVVGVSTYVQAVAEAKRLYADGVRAFELCAGFGTNGIAAVKNALPDDAVVGAVRFDLHPAFGYKSGDAVFA
ncbi:DUF6506 family protein [Telmatospirillum sp.]|uniref:DUF6506 family protein n=1 Tax=Telmatospirillum sp. TaxID=2079197 RepID=UPI00285177A9|nr:DUF6506 family protein [Telmatospirillum sp.]MDR3440321.1 DUF6506 family protein [Telmatospirillum sp.]